jgi:hypothetical protein
MAGKRLNSENLAKQLESLRFKLNLPEAKKDGISFIRRSSVDRLYEHLLIYAKNPVYAEIAISAATFTSCHACVSERDSHFRALLTGNTRYRTCMLGSAKEWKAWQQLLVDNLDSHCIAASTEKGPELVGRLQLVFDAVDAYAQKLGDMFAILDREFAFVSNTSPSEQAEIERLATLAHSMLYLNSEDAKLASLALVRFGAEVEGHPQPFHSKKPQRDKPLAARLILLADFVGKKRIEYRVAGGFRRQRDSFPY